MKTQGKNHLAKASDKLPHQHCPQWKLDQWCQLFNNRKKHGETPQKDRSAERWSHWKINKLLKKKVLIYLWTFFEEKIWILSWILDFIQRSGGNLLRKITLKWTFCAIGTTLNILSLSPQISFQHKNRNTNGTFWDQKRCNRSITARVIRRWNS